MNASPCAASPEGLVDQIARLHESFDRAQQGDFAAPCQAGLLEPDEPCLDLDAQLKASSLAILLNSLRAGELAHKQIQNLFLFLQITTFFGRSVCSDPAFWTCEINDDLIQTQNLFLTAQDNLEFVLITRNRQQGHFDPRTEAGRVFLSTGDQVLDLSQKQRDLLKDFDHRNERRVQGKTCFEASETPLGIDSRNAQEALLDLRQIQFQDCLTHIEMLLDRSILCLKRVHLISTQIIPADPHHFQWVESWKTEMAPSFVNGQNDLAQADDILASHAARHSAFPRRLSAAQNPAQGL